MKTNAPQRHDILFLSPAGQKYAWEHRRSPTLESSRHKDQFFSLPGIYRNQAECSSPSHICIGFSFPVRKDGSRIRIASEVPSSEIKAIVTPWDIPPLVNHLPQKPKIVLQELARTAEDHTLSFGIFGSAALQAVTGFPYLHQASDLDTLIAPASPETIRTFYTRLKQLEQFHSIRIDGELMINDRHYIKLHELMSGQKTVLAKGGHTPVLLSSQSIWDTMAALPR